MASGNRTKYPNKRDLPREGDYPETMEALLAAERERNAGRAPQQLTTMCPTAGRKEDDDGSSSAV